MRSFNMEMIEMYTIFKNIFSDNMKQNQTGTFLLLDNQHKYNKTIQLKQKSSNQKYFIAENLPKCERHNPLELRKYYIFLKIIPDLQINKTVDFVTEETLDFAKRDRKVIQKCNPESKLK